MNTLIKLNPDQNEAMAAISDFLMSPNLDAFVLCGSAGTGKTTLVAKIIELAHQLLLDSLLVAPTGRAAQILQGKLSQMLPSSMGAPFVSTIHSALYYMASLEVDEERLEEGLSTIQMGFSIKKQKEPFDLLIVDETSMVGDNPTNQSSMMFGSGRLLSDLIDHTQDLYRKGIVNRPIKVLFVGDLAQLPPVGSQDSPALSPKYLYNYFGLNARRYELTTVMRQGDKSGILSFANQIRERIFTGYRGDFSIPFNRYDICPIDFHPAVNLIANNISQNLSCAAVVYSNAMAKEYNLSVRAQLWGNAYAPISPRDRLLVTRNSPEYGLSNGDLVDVHTVMTNSHEERVYLPNGQIANLKFREVRLQLSMVSGVTQVVETLILENLLYSSKRELEETEQHALYLLVCQRNPFVDPNSHEFRELLQTDRYFNALQVKFGYAMTCHKAQGGEWEQVILDPTGVNTNSDMGYRWMYTAVTRASYCLFVVQ
ncbi:ATP-dependent DNA helicase [Neptuniibacter sp. QD29_5]|uniref:ATP-dependent DNA helicase n=1 Tax=Neptuniibacter sp. QD29_5 TaxID=3398207 RepID=UPI0039F55DD4